jgi:hypothetical protein
MLKSADGGARGGIEPPIFRFSDGSNCGTNSFMLVRRGQLDQQAVVEPLVLRLAADKWRTDSPLTKGAGHGAVDGRRASKPISIRITFRPGLALRTFEDLPQEGSAVRRQDSSRQMTGPAPGLNGRPAPPCNAATAPPTCEYANASNASY